MNVTKSLFAVAALAVAGQASASVFDFEDTSGFGPFTAATASSDGQLLLSQSPDVLNTTGGNGGQIAFFGPATANATANFSVATAAAPGTPLPTFIVESADIRVNEDQSVATLTGTLAGVQVFSIVVDGAVADDQYNTYLTGTTSPVDSLTFNHTSTAALNSTGIDNIVINQIPEPASLALLGLGGIALLGRRRSA